jgi:hypothetical protein
MSGSLYLSITFGRKDTRCPPGSSKRARATRSAASAEDSYSLVDGAYDWSPVISTAGKENLRSYVRALVYSCVRVVVRVGEAPGELKAQEINPAHGAP